VWQHFSWIANAIDSEKCLYAICQALFISITGPKVAQGIQVVFILLHEAKPVLGLFCLHLNKIGNVTSSICRDNWLGFKSLGLRLMVKF